MKPSLQQVIEDLDFVSGRISEQIRTICLSILGLVWLFLTGGKDAPALPKPPNTHLLLLVGALALLGLVSDYLQYLMGLFASDQLRKQAERNKSKEILYKCDSFFYRARDLFFWVKQILAILAVILLFVTIIGSLKAL